MLHTAKNALYRLVSTVAFNGPVQGLSMPTPIMAIKTAVKMLKNAAFATLATPMVGSIRRADGLTSNRQIRHIRRRTRQRQDIRNNQADHPEHDRACPMVRDRVHSNRKRQQVARHDKDDQQQLSHAEDLASDSPEDDLAGISHVLDMRVGPAELADHVAGISGN